MNSDAKIGVIVLLAICSGIGFVLLAAPSSEENYQSSENLITKIFNSNKDKSDKSYLDRELSIDLLDKEEKPQAQPEIIKELPKSKPEVLNLPDENISDLQNKEGSTEVVKDNMANSVEKPKEVADIVSIEKPKDEPSKTSEKPLETKKLEDFNYTVKSGDNLYKIAKDYYQDGNKHALITLANNGIKSENLKVGMKIVLPGEESQKKLGINTKVIDKKPMIENNKPVIYKVKSGDTISVIARKFYGKDYSMDEIKKANAGKDLGKLKIGESINIPVQSKKN